MFWMVLNFCDSNLNTKFKLQFRSLSYDYSLNSFYDAAEFSPNESHIEFGIFITETDKSLSNGLTSFRSSVQCIKLSVCLCLPIIHRGLDLMNLHFVRNYKQIFYLALRMHYFKTQKATIGITDNFCNCIWIRLSFALKNIQLKLRDSSKWFFS
jgi:hypothetical protein